METLALYNIKIAPYRIQPCGFVFDGMITVVRQSHYLATCVADGQAHFSDDYLLAPAIFSNFTQLKISEVK